MAILLKYSACVGHGARLQRMTSTSRHSGVLTALALGLTLCHLANLFGETAYGMLCDAVIVNFSAETRYDGCGPQSVTIIGIRTFYLERDVYTIQPIVAVRQWSNGLVHLGSGAYKYFEVRCKEHDHREPLQPNHMRQT